MISHDNEEQKGINWRHTRHYGDTVVCCVVAELCPVLCHPMDCSPPASSVRGISQARIQEWVVISFSRGSS